MNSSDTAVIVFAKRPEPGKVKTRLATGVGDERAVKIYRRLVEYTVGEVRISSADVWLYYAPEDAEPFFRDWLGMMEFRSQAEGDLGARMLAAFQAGHAEKTIIIGTDCPDLNSAVLNTASLALDEADLVLGPTFDGGYYLVAARKPYPALFDRMPWSTDQVLDETLFRAQELGLRTRLLKKLLDVDTTEDLDASGFDKDN